MAQTPPRLPSEVWNRVFSCLSTADKLSVRASCKYFNTLVDHGSLWRDWAVVLRFNSGYYNRRFWASLRRRRVTSAVVRSSRVKDWKQVAHFLPSATTVVMDTSSQQSLHYVRDFADLRRLAVRNSSTSLVFDSSTVCKPEQLTHLSLCDVTLPTATIEGVISAVSHFTNLTSLVCHRTGVLQETIILVHSLLSCLPKLKHLSLSVAHTFCCLNTVPSLNIPGGGRAPALSSLELIDCMDLSFPKDSMKLMPGLKSLAVFFRHSQQEWPSPVCHLNTWLSDLPQLSTLVILKGPAVKNYVTSIPPTVTSLTLCVAEFSSKDLAATAAQVPDLLQLHIDPWPSHLGAHTAQIPLLFPKLRRLKVRLEHVPEEKFLALHKLPDLEYLEVLDSLPHFSQLIIKLRALTNYRLEVKTPPRQRDVMSCSCVCY
ncbi:unnamed protein product [Pleuronectes platessa]|uniref:F-box domain-containing protein n=1 Tax=Pleuronectes platessa TaxID=8262 RepID=A0A9N7VMR7_PLEPL|nr:unnamed protein product [Pleuronectes platessa]